MVEIQQLSKQYGGKVRALNRVNLSIQSGEIVSILGPSGAGKSTLLRCINGLEMPDEGTVTVDGIPVLDKNLRQIRRKVGMVFQKASLIPRSSVMMNVLIGRISYRAWFTNLVGWFSAEDYRLAADALQEVRLLDRAWDRGDKLSGGQQQRVGIARTMVQGAKVILADEPVASLDPETSHEVMRLLTGVAQNHGVTLILNLHQVELARAYSKRVIGLRAGEVAFDLPSSDLDEGLLQNLYRRDAAASEPEVVERPHLAPAF